MATKRYLKEFERQYCIMEGRAGCIIRGDSFVIVVYKGGRYWGSFNTIFREDWVYAYEGDLFNYTVYVAGYGYEGVSLALWIYNNLQRFMKLGWRCLK